jgi:electron transfer flavoprotein alpha/beta subunit
MRVAVVVVQAWDPASIELEPVRDEIDWSRAAAVAAPGSLEAVEVGLGLGGVTAFGMGPAPPEPLLRRCLAMGAASAALVPDPWSLAAALGAGAFDLVLVPHRAGDQSPSALGPTLAALTGLPQATAVESLRADGGRLVFTRRLGRGRREELALRLPAVVAVEPGLVRAREPSPAALVASQSATIPALEPAAPAGAVFRRYLAPRPAPRRLHAPAPDLPAEARIAAVMGGSDRVKREVVTGSAEEVAARIVSLLVERGYLSGG